MIKIDEKHLEDILYELIQTAAGCAKLQEKGLGINYEENSLYYRQLNLKEYGIPDIIRVQVHGYYFAIDVIELKVTEFNIAHLLQLGRYMSGIHHIVGDDTNHNRAYTVNGYLIVGHFDGDNDYAWAARTLNNNIHIYSAAYTIDGMHFTKQLPGDWRINSAKTGAINYINTDDLKSVFKRSLLDKDDVHEPMDDLPY